MTLFYNVTAKIENNKLLLVFLLFVFHVCLATGLFLIANSEYVSHLHNGEGFWNFARDSIKYHKESLESLVFLQESRWVEWWYSYDIHHNVKLISLVYWFTGYNVPISFEIINGLVWTASVVLIYRTSRLLFTNNVVIPVVAVLFLFQPSFLMSSTQLLRDPMFVLGVCLMIYGWVIFANDDAKWNWTLWVNFGFALFLLMRPYLGTFVVMVYVSYTFFLLVTRRVKISHAIIFLIPLVLSQMLIQNNYFDPVVNDSSVIYSKKFEKTHESERVKLRIDLQKEEISFLDRLALQGSIMRYGFYTSIPNATAGSKIDFDIKFESFFDVVEYLPRAVQVAFFAPFPNDWFSEGKETGRIGKLLAGLEMLVWYAILIGFIYVVFNNFSMLKPLIPMLILSAIIITLLGYVVPNVGAIFRMRQGFMIPFFIFGCYGLYLMIYQKVVKSE